MADLWKEAINGLSTVDQGVITANFQKTGHATDAIQLALDAASKKKEECLQRRWKVKLGEKTIILRDVIEKVTSWLTRVVAVGDVLVQYDPGHAAVPWAIIRFFLQMTVTDVQIFGTVLTSIELVSKTLARSAIVERLYLGPTFDVSKSLHDTLVALYNDILQFLLKIYHYFNQSSVARISKSFITNPKNIEEWSAPLVTKDLELEKLARLADAEQLQDIDSKLEELSEDQKLEREEQVKRDGELKKMLQDLDQPITRVDQRLSEIQDNLNIETRLRILKSISNIPYAPHHKRTAKDRLPGSGEWLIQKSVFKDWREKSSPSVLWLHGIPGSGKTKVTSRAIDEIMGTVQLAYFYCSQNSAEPERAHCDTILASLVRQLACPSRNGSILEPVRLKYDIDQMGLEDFPNDWTTEECQNLLVDLTSLYPAVVLVIDGLDEVDILERPELLDALTFIMAESASLVKIFISSRDNGDIVMRLKQFPNVYISANENEGDIQAFVYQKVEDAKLLHGNLTNGLKIKIHTVLTIGAQGMFRWVDLQIQSLRRLKVAADIESRLGRLPETLEDSYWEIYQQIQESGENAAKLATFCFQWLLCAHSSIQLVDFAKLASFATDTPISGYSENEILDVCSNLVIEEEPDAAKSVKEPGGLKAVDDDNSGPTFRFAHLSVKEFLEGLEKRGITAFRLEEANASIAYASISCLFSIYEPSAGRELDGRNDSVKDDKLLDYLERHWPQHVTASGSLRNTPELSSKVENFLVRDKQVAPTFVKWCSKIREKESPEFKDYVEPPYNPLWIAQKEDLIDIDRITISDERLQKSTLEQLARSDDHSLIYWLEYHHFDFVKYGMDALSLAVGQGQLRMVQMLLDKGVHVRRADLFVAALIQNEYIISALLAERCDSFTEEDMIKTLTSAVSSGLQRTTEELLQRGVPREPEAVARAIRRGILRAAHNLIDHGFNIMMPCFYDERTPLHWAAIAGYDDIVEKLLKKGARADIPDREDNTPLQLAILKKHEATTALIQKHIKDNTAGVCQLSLVDRN